MTDEEKAIDYAETECCHSCTGSCGDIKCNMYYNVRNAVLYGLAEGKKEKWHDLRKDPNELPKLEDKCYSWSVTVANQLGEACHYNYSKSCWETPLFTEKDKVIAWCELPKFEEE